MGAQGSELAARALAPVVDHQLVHDISEGEFHRAHGAVGHHEVAGLHPGGLEVRRRRLEARGLDLDVGALKAGMPALHRTHLAAKIASASRRERVCSYASLSGDAVALHIKLRSTRNQATDTKS